VPPNVIIILTDDQGYGDLGCHGNPVIRTPDLDALHAASVCLTDFHVAPTCSPTRAGLMTGRNCNRTGVWHTIMGRSILRRDEVTMAEVFRDSGYRTGIFGKWHLGDNYPSRPQDKGFEEALIHKGGGVGQTPDLWGNDYTDDTYFHDGVPEPQQGYCTDVFFDAAMRFIEDSRDRPFFAYIATNAPHQPYNIAETWVQPYHDAGVEEGLARFYGTIGNIDSNVGRLMAHLDALGLAEDTILIFMTDNGTGDQGYNAGMRGRKGSQYDGGHRVPCFVRWPGGGLAPAGSDVTRLTAHLDMLPTLAELCGLTLPDGVRLDGVSIAPLLRDPLSEWTDRTIVVDSQRVEHPEMWRASAVMTERWRLIDGKELYDIQADPGQATDIARAHPEVVAELRAAYEAWWEDVSSRFGECCAIVVGSERENPSHLTCHDWHEADCPWNQDMIREGNVANGFWAIEVAAAGEYEVSLRRWPEEADTPTNAAVEGGVAIRATEARLKVGDVDVRQAISEGARASVFRVSLPLGKTTMQTWFTGDTGEDRGAYYVTVRRLPASPL